MIDLIGILIPAILTGIFGFLFGVFNKQKERDFELAKVKASMYNELFESLRPALFSDYIDDKTIEEETKRYQHWQEALRKSDRLWLYADDRVLQDFKELFDGYKDKDKERYNKKLEDFVISCRKDVLKSLGNKKSNERYKFITYNLPKTILKENFNRLE